MGAELACVYAPEECSYRKTFCSVIVKCARKGSRITANAESVVRVDQVSYIVFMATLTSSPSRSFHIVTMC